MVSPSSLALGPSGGRMRQPLDAPGRPLYTLRVRDDSPAMGGGRMGEGMGDRLGASEGDADEPPVAAGRCILCAVADHGCDIASVEGVILRVHAPAGSEHLPAI